jgi:hypothetical protein
MKKLYFLIFILLILSINCQEEAVNKEKMKEYESPGLDEDNFIMNLIKKHDPEEKLYFSRE